MALLSGVRDVGGGGAFGDWMLEVLLAEGECGCLGFWGLGIDGVIIVISEQKTWRSGMRECGRRTGVSGGRSEVGVLGAWC